MNPVEKFIETLEHPKKEMAGILRHFILSVDPEIKEKISWGIPFFYKKKNICYFSPVTNGIDIGFVQGRYINVVHPNFDQKDRKQVKTMTFHLADEIDFELLLIVLNEALALDNS